jgi:hypothetical protein
MLMLLLAGCAPRPAVTMTAIDQPVMHGLQPHQAVYSRSPDGMLDILLVREPVDPGSPARAGQPLRPAERVPLREIVHVRVFWRPPRGTESDHPAAANSAMTWYFIGVGTAQQQDLLAYEGSGFAAVDPSGKGLSVTIRDAYVRAGPQRGAVADPLGTARLTGRFEARRDEARVQQLLQEIRFATEAPAALEAPAGHRQSANDDRRGSASPGESPR